MREPSRSRGELSRSSGELKYEMGKPGKSRENSVEMYRKEKDFFFSKIMLYEGSRKHTGIKAETDP